MNNQFSSKIYLSKGLNLHVMNNIDFATKGEIWKIYKIYFFKNIFISKNLSFIAEKIIIAYL